MHVLALSLKNQMGEIGRATSEIQAFAERHGVDRSARRRLAVVVDDLLANVITYAYPGGGAHEIELELVVTPERLELTIIDAGTPFNPLSADKPVLHELLEDRVIGGLGLHIALSVMDDASYERRGEKNVVRLTKRLIRDADGPSR